MQLMFNAKMNSMHSILVMIFSNLHPRPDIIDLVILSPAVVHGLRRLLGGPREIRAIKRW
jgi:hypothetical protein